MAEVIAISIMGAMALGPIIYSGYKEYRWKCKLEKDSGIPDSELKEDFLVLDQDQVVDIVNTLYKDHKELMETEKLLDITAIGNNCWSNNGVEWQNVGFLYYSARPYLCTLRWFSGLNPNNNLQMVFKGETAYKLFAIMVFIGKTKSRGHKFDREKIMAECEKLKSKYQPEAEVAL